VEPWVIGVTLVAVVVSFTVSASAGLGGSLILVPTLALVLGTKEGVALAALLLALNNVVKVFAYKKTLPFRKAAVVIVLVAVGAAVGARLLVAAPVEIVTIAVIASKGMAIRQLDLDRSHFVGAASLASFAGDAAKTVVFAQAELLVSSSLMIALLAFPLMILSTFAGRSINYSIGEKGYTALFWAVMGGYSLRLVFGLFA
jgi:uncharacterized membrane protein YfcA